MFEVGKEYRNKYSCNHVKCLAIHDGEAWLKPFGINSKSFTSRDFNAYEEYKPPVIEERFVNIYDPNLGVGSACFSREAADTVSAKGRIGVAKYTWTDGKITSITICD